MNIKILSVSEVNNYIKRIVDNDFILSNLSVKGEISNLKFHSSGHIYFSLKDSKSKINCIMFKSRAVKLKIELKEGLEVIIKGNASIYPATGNMQIYCDKITREGEGELFYKFEELKKKLEEKGYFDVSAKKDIPKYPRRIGVVTSPTGAAIRDIIFVTTRRNSLVDLVLYPAKVQGIFAYKEIIDGIEYFNKKNNVDLIIIGRGGGSIEELWNFNEEELAKTIYSSEIPIISAVGHETDFTISDFVSDLRAATPSQGAEIGVPLESEMRRNIDELLKSIYALVNDKLLLCKNEINSLDRILNLNSPMNKIKNSYIECDTLKNKLDWLIKGRLEKEKEKAINLNGILMAHNPINVLKRGYTIIEDEKNNIIKSKKNMDFNKDIKITFKDGSIVGKFMQNK